MTEAQGFRGGTSRTTLNAALDDFWDCALAFGAAFNLVDAAFTALRWPLNNGRPGDLPWHLPQALWDISRTAQFELVSRLTHPPHFCPPASSVESPVPASAAPSLPT